MSLNLSNIGSQTSSLGQSLIVVRSVFEQKKQNKISFSKIIDKSTSLCKLTLIRYFLKLVINVLSEFYQFVILVLFGCVKSLSTSRVQYFLLDRRMLTRQCIVERTSAGLLRFHRLLKTWPRLSQLLITTSLPTIYISSINFSHTDPLNFRIACNLGSGAPWCLR